MKSCFYLPWSNRKQNRLKFVHLASAGFYKTYLPLFHTHLLKFNWLGFYSESLHNSHEMWSYATSVKTRLFVVTTVHLKIYTNQAQAGAKGVGSCVGACRAKFAIADALNASGKIEAAWRENQQNRTLENHQNPRGAVALSEWRSPRETELAITSSRTRFQAKSSRMHLSTPITTKSSASCSKES